MLDYSLGKQDNLAKEEGNTAIIHEGEVDNWTQVGQIRERERDTPEGQHLTGHGV